MWVMMSFPFSYPSDNQIGRRHALQFEFSLQMMKAKVMQKIEEYKPYTANFGEIAKAKFMGKTF